MPHRALFGVMDADTCNFRPTFRDMVTGGLSSRIELVDRETETAATFTSLLGPIQGELINTQSVPEAIPLNKLVRLAHKYECAALLDTISSQLYRDLAKYAHWEHHVFRLAIALGDVEFSAAARRTTPGSIWSALPRGDLMCLEGESILDPSSLALDNFVTFDRETLWVWLRSYRHAFGWNSDIDHNAKFTAMSEEFVRLKTLMQVPLP